MPLRKTVAMERRMDLASLFCLIARHGPAVLVTLLVIGCSLAGFVMFRKMREKRRRRRAAAGAGRRDSGDAGPEEEPCAGEKLSRRGSTDARIEEDDFHSHVRQRSAAPERDSYKDKLPDTANDRGTYSFFWDRYFPKATESHAEEAPYNSDRSYFHPSAEDVTEVCEAELIKDHRYEESEKAIEADSSEDITSTAEDVSEEEEYASEEAVHFSFNNQLHSAPAPDLTADDRQVNTEEADVKREHEPEHSMAPVSTLEEISAPCVEDRDVVVEESLPVLQTEPAAMPHEEQADLPIPDLPFDENTVPPTLSPELTDENPADSDSCRSEPFEPVCGKDDRSLVPTADVVVAELSTNGQQQTEHPVSSTSDTEIKQSGLGPEEPTHSDPDTCSNNTDIGPEKTVCSETTFDDGKNVSDLAVGSSSPAVDLSENKSPDPMTEKVDVDSTLSERASAEQYPNHQDNISKVQESNQSCEQKDLTLEEPETLPSCKDDHLNLNQKEGQSINTDLPNEKSSVHPSTSQTPLHTVITETSLSGLAADVEAIPAVTETVVQANNQNALEGTVALVTETILRASPQIGDVESCLKDGTVHAANISAATRDKIESMVAQMVAEVYKDVTQTALETKAMQLEENKCTVATSNSEAPHDLDSEAVVESEVIAPCTAMHPTEETVSPVSDQNGVTKLEEKVETEVFEGVISDHACPNPPLNEETPVIEALTNPQDSTHSKTDMAEALVMDKNVEKESSVPEDAPLVQDPAIDVQSPQLDLNSSGVTENKESIVKSVIETIADYVCSAEMKDELIVPCLDVSNDENVENEKEIQSHAEGEAAESAATSWTLQNGELKEPEVCLDVNSGPFDKPESEVENSHLEINGGPKIESDIKTEVTENTATLSDQSEPKEPEMLLDSSNNSSDMSPKSSRVVIICRTLEESVSTLEMSDSEDIAEEETTDLDLTNANMSSPQEHSDILRDLTEEAGAGEVVESSDSLVVQAVIEEVTAAEMQHAETGGPLHFTNGDAHDDIKDGSASVDSTEQVEPHDDAACHQSEISSMSVNPEKEEANEIIGHDVLFVEGSVSNGVLEASSFLQSSQLEEIIKAESMTNEDSFGSEIEDGYLKATEELMTQVIDISGKNEDVTKAKNLDEKKDQACAADKEDGEKVDSEKTEISIMEATMDHNEWITDGNCQVLPWMTAASFSMDSISTKEVKDAAESTPQAQTSSAEESLENSKKVLAVQPMPQNVNVTFRIHYVTLLPNQTVAVTGDQPELGAWRSTVPLEKTKDGYWTCVVGLPAESQVEWKFVVLENGEVCRWEECGNRQLYTGFGDDLLVHKWWGFL